MDHFEEETRAIKEILKHADCGMSITEIARAMNRNNHSVGRYLDNLLVSGQVEMRTYGKAKVFTLSSRIPFDNLMGFADDLIIVLDQDYRIVRVNNSVLDFFSKTRNDFVGRNIRFLSFKENWIGNFFEKVCSFLASDSPEEEIHTAGKTERVFRKKIIPTVFEDGKQGITILLEDITTKKQAERDLRSSEERFRMLAENIQDGILIWEGGRAIYMNQRAEEIFGYSSEELSMRSPVEIAVPEERERLSRILSDSLDHKSIPADIRFWIARKDGSRRYILNRITSITHTNGVTVYIIITDFTEWKHAQDALENQLGFLQHMINTYPNPLFYLDTLGRFLGCNTAFCSLLQKPIEEIAGRAIGEILGQGPARTFDEANTELPENKGVVIALVVFSLSDGTRWKLAIQKSRLILADGNTAGTVGLILSMENLGT
jgi:PAS domain S-box-containing protein